MKVITFWYSYGTYAYCIYNIQHCIRLCLYEFRVNSAKSEVFLGWTSKELENRSLTSENGYSRLNTFLNVLARKLL